MDENKKIIKQIGDEAEEKEENSNSENTIVELPEEVPLQQQQQLEKVGENEPATLIVGSLVVDDAPTSTAAHEAEAEEESLSVAETLPEIVAENNYNTVVVEPMALFVLGVQVCESLSIRVYQSNNQP